MSDVLLKKCPEPGIHRGVPAEEYFAWDAVSNSRLSLMKRSPLHYRSGFGDPTAQMRLGSLVHSGVLEPLSIAKRYVFMPDYSNHPDNVTSNGTRSFSSATTFVKQMQESFRKLNHDKEIVSEDDYNRMVGMAQALTSHQTSRRLFAEGEAEVSLVWDDSTTGLRCKARMDWLKPSGSPLCVDLKTTMDGAEFERAIVRYGYHRQMAFYARGLAALGIDAEPWICCIETKSPYGVRAARMDSEALACGSREASELLERVLECQQADQWPGYSDPEFWGLPEWYMRPAGACDFLPSDGLTEWFESATEAGAVAAV